jgi:hypothetical protein
MQTSIRYRLRLLMLLALLVIVMNIVASVYGIY